MKKQKRIWAHGFMLLSLIGFSTFAPVTAVGSSAKTTNSDLTQAVTQSYGADSSVQVGMVVMLNDKDPSSVEPAAQADSSKILGIVVPANASAVTLTPQNVKQQQVFVATSGRYNVLVSNQNGAIKTGDSVVISAIAGVGMKADETQPVAVGKARASFNGTGNVIGTLKLKDSVGHEVTVSLGNIAVDLSVSHNPLQSKSTDNLPGFLVKAAQSVSGRPVSAARIYLSLAVLVITGFVTASLIYSGVRSGMQAVGRNPLSRKSIIKSLIQTVIAGLIIFVAGVFGVYLLLKL